MGLLDKAKGLVEGHKDQIQHGLDKAKQTVNKASESVNQSVNKRLPNSGTTTPVGQSAPPDDSVPSDEVEADQTAPTGGEVSGAPAPQPGAQGGPGKNP